VTLTGVVPETIMASLRIPAGSIGKNGAVQVTALWTYPNSANNKALVTRFSATAGVTGSTVETFNATTTATAQTLVIMHANNATNAQAFYVSPVANPYGTNTTALNTTTVDTTADSFVNITGTVAGAGETLTLQHAYAVVTQAN
jgi:hypothetical protein